jgi:hypothetical protein
VRVSARVLRLNDWDTSARNSYSRGVGVLFDGIEESAARAIEVFVRREVESEES